MIPFRKSLAFRLLLISVILLALPLLVDSFVVIQSSYKDAIQEAKSYLVEIATDRSLPLNTLQVVKGPTLHVVESLMHLETQFPEKQSKELNEKLSQLAIAAKVDNVTLLKKTSEDRYIVIASNRAEWLGVDTTDLLKLMDVFKPIVYEAGYFTYIFYSVYSHEPYSLTGRMIYSPEGAVLGALTFFSDITHSLGKFLATSSNGFTVNFALLLPNTFVIDASDPTLQFQYFAPLDDATKQLLESQIGFTRKQIPDGPLTTKMTYPFFEFMWQGEKQVGYLKKMAFSDITLLAYTSRKAVLAEPFLQFWGVYSGYLLILLIGGLLAYLCTRKLAEPLSRLGGVMKDIQKGNLLARYHDTPLGFEINTLGDVFNKMIDTLLQKQGQAERESVARETYAKELMIGQHVQRSLLVEKMPEYPGVELAERYIPAKEVGGDFYDVYVRKNRDNREQLAVTIADASGKGVHACFYSLGVKNILRAYAKECDDVAEVMTLTNDLFCVDTGESGMFITVFMGYYDQYTKEFSYFSCGHNPPFLRKASGEIIVLSHSGMAMGVEKKIIAKSASLQLQTGDLLVMYTDGITEAHDRDYQMFSEKRLQRFLRGKGNLSANQVADQLLEEVQAFVGEAPQHDDMTLLIMRVP